MTGASSEKTQIAEASQASVSVLVVSSNGLSRTASVERPNF